MRRVTQKKIDFTVDINGQIERLKRNHLFL